MNGNEIYENNYKEKINNLIKSNPDKEYLRGFSNFINKSYSTIYNYLNYVISFINYINKPVENLYLDDYTDFLSTIEDKTSSYKISVYSGLKKFSLYLSASDRNKRNPMQYVDRPKFTEKESTKLKRENGYLTTGEIHKYINSINKGIGTDRAKARQENWKTRDKAIIMLLLSTGIRCSALYKLNLDSIDYDNKKLITIDKGGQYKERPLSDQVISVIEDWIKDRNNIASDDEPALFLSNQKTRITQSSISKIVNKYAYSIQGKHITPHKLRATYGTQLYNKTGDLYMVQECMGHSNPKTTELYIRGQKNETAQKAADIMTKIIF